MEPHAATRTSVTHVAGPAVSNLPTCATQQSRHEHFHIGSLRGCKKASTGFSLHAGPPERAVDVNPVGPPTSLPNVSSVAIGTATMPTTAVNKKRGLPVGASAAMPATVASIPVGPTASVSSPPAVVSTTSITLAVDDDGDAGRMIFLIPRTTPLQRLMQYYCNRRSLHQSFVQFMIDDERLEPDDTAEALGLEDGDVLSAQCLAPARQILP